MENLLLLNITGNSEFKTQDSLVYLSSHFQRLVSNSLFQLFETNIFFQNVKSSDDMFGLLFYTVWPGAVNWHHKHNNSM